MSDMHYQFIWIGSQGYPASLQYEDEALDELGVLVRDYVTYHLCKRPPTTSHLCISSIRIERLP